MDGALASETSPVMVVPSAGAGGPPTVLVEREQATTTTARIARVARANGLRRIFQSG